MLVSSTPAPTAMNASCETKHHGRYFASWPSVRRSCPELWGYPLHELNAAEGKRHECPSTLGRFTEIDSSHTSIASSATAESRHAASLRRPNDQEIAKTPAREHRAHTILQGGPKVADEPNGQRLAFPSERTSLGAV